MTRTPSKPLTKDELQRLHETAHSGGGLNKHHIFLPIDIIPYTGLYPAEFCHLHRDWITFPGDVDGNEDDPILIKVPESQECPKIRLGNGFVTTVDEPCPHCRKTKGPDRWERRYDTRDRIIEVVGEPARKALKSWFSLHDAIPHSVPSLSENITKVAREAGFERKITTTSLRKTYPVMLAKMGFPVDYILDTAGYSIKQRLPDRAVDLLRERPETDFHTIWPTHELLAYLEENGPVRTERIGADLKWDAAPLRLQLRQLVELKIISPPMKDGLHNVWDYDGAFGTNPPCPVDDCSKSFSTLRGLSMHTAAAHPGW